MVDDLLRPEARAEAGSLRAALDEMGAPEGIARRIVRLFEMNGAVGLAVLGQKLSVDEIQLTRAYTKLGEALGLDWAQNAANHFQARDQWERLLTAGLARDFEQLRLEFLERRKSDDPKATVDKWVAEPGPAHRAVPPHRRARPHRLGHHRADARPDRDPGAGAAGALAPRAFEQPDPDRAGQIGRRPARRPARRRSGPPARSAAALRPPPPRAAPPRRPAPG